MDDQGLFNDIYCFVIKNDAEGYAHFGLVYKRKEATSTRIAADEIMSGVAGKSWDDVTTTHAADGLDMKFAVADNALVFVFIAPDHSAVTPKPAHAGYTYFGKEKVADLALAPRKPARIIRKPELHPAGAAHPQLCSFELDVAAIRSGMGHGPNNPLTRFPVVFDFVDTPGDISPVFKAPKRAGSGAGILEHGGIHPRGGSSVIIVDGP